MGNSGRCAFSEEHAMTGLWVALSVRKTIAEIRAMLEEWFPALAVEDWDLSSADRAEEALRTEAIGSADILFQVEYNSSEFPTAIHFDRFPGPQDEAVVQPTMIELARMFATAFACRTITDGSGYGDDDSPYWDIIWDKGRSFLVDDCNTEFRDQTGGSVRIVREISLSSFGLDDSGRLIE
jgi:hypothetical protein